MKQKEYLVIGASGKTGRRVVRDLRDRGESVRAASRSSETRFDWQDPTSWQPALEGIQGVYFVAPEDHALHEGSTLMKDFVAAAESAGVERVVLLSARNLEGKYLFEASMVPAEAAVKASSLQWTIVRANFFMQNFDEEFLFEPIKAGSLALPTGNVPEPFIDADDIAAVVAAVLVEDGHNGRVYEISGSEAITYADAVAQIAEACGRPVAYEDLSPEAYEQELMRAGLEGEGLAEFCSLWQAVRDGVYAEPTDTVRQILGRDPIKFNDYARKVAKTGVWN